MVPADAAEADQSTWKRLLTPAHGRAADAVAAVERGAHPLDIVLHLGRRDQLRRDQLVGIGCPRGLVVADLLVHHRLRHRRLVGLVVAVAAVADQVDDDVLY
jgi:hypothetical protein